MIDDDPTRARYEPDEDRELSAAILEAVEEHTGEDLMRAEFRLYDDINPDALNALFRDGASANVTLQFDFGDVSVTLWLDGEVEIRIATHDGGV